MPGGDRTGPLGMGPLTGRGAGYCRGYETPGYANNFPGGRGAGRGVGFGGGGYGRGRRNRFFATGIPGRGWNRQGGAASVAFHEPSPNQERQYLEQEAEALRRQLAEIDQRLDQLKNDKER